MDSGQAYINDGYYVKGKFTGYGAEINGDWYHHEGFFKDDNREGLGKSTIFETKFDLMMKKKTKQVYP